MNRERTRNTIVLFDDQCPAARVVHIASMDRPTEDWLWLNVVWYGKEANEYGAIPVVCTAEDHNWLAGEMFVHKGRYVVGAVNGYADEDTALSYVRDRNRVWTADR